MHFVNPHSYMEIDAVDANGKKLHMRCEMRAATLLKRSGWSTEMFKSGPHVEIEGHPHRTDPHACYIENFKIGDAPKMNRNDQFETKTQVDTSKRPLHLADGQPNISGDWAVEQLVLTVPPSGGNGSMIPKSHVAGVRGRQDHVAAGAGHAAAAAESRVHGRGPESGRRLQQTVTEGQSLV